MTHDYASNWMFWVAAYVLVGSACVLLVDMYYRLVTGTTRIAWRFMFVWPLFVVLFVVGLVMVAFGWHRDRNT